MNITMDRISPLTTLLDEVFYKSSIEDIRRSYFQHFYEAKTWLLLSDYYFGNEKTNKVVTFTVLPYMGFIPQLQNVIRSLAPKDFKHARTFDPRLAEFLKQSPMVNISFLFQQDKYFAWSRSSEFQDYMTEFCDRLSCYASFWRKESPNQARLDALARNVKYTRELLHSKRKILLLCETFIVSLLGGYVGSILCRETDLENLCWLSDRDKTNELGKNLVRDFFKSH